MLSTIVISLLMVSALFLSAAAESNKKVLYTGFRVVETDRLKNVNQVNAVRSVIDSKTRKVLLFEDEVFIGSGSSLLVAPERWSFVEEILNVNKIEFKITNHDYQRTLDEHEQKNNESLQRMRRLQKLGLTGIDHTAYLSYDEQYSWLLMKASCGILCENVSFYGELGYTCEGREIVAITVNIRYTSLPLVWIDANIRASDWLTSATALYIIDQIISAFTDDGKYLKQNFRIIIMPNTNPDGYEHSRLYDRLWKKNREPLDGCDPYGRNLKVARAALIERMIKHAYAGSTETEETTTTFTTTKTTTTTMVTTETDSTTSSTTITSTAGSPATTVTTETTNGSESTTTNAVNVTDCVGVNLSLNWDAGFGGGGSSNDTCDDNYHGPSQMSEQETLAMATTIDAQQQDDQNLLLYISFQSYAQRWLIPYGWTFDIPYDYSEMLHRDPFEKQGMPRVNTHTRNYFLSLERVANAAVQQIAYINGNKNGTDFDIGRPLDFGGITSGASFDWVKMFFHVPYSYQVNLRPKTAGDGGVSVPPDQIVPSGEEILAAVAAAAREARKSIISPHHARNQDFRA